MSYHVNYEDFEYPKFDDFPDSQQVSDPISLEDAFSLTAQLEAEQFLSNGCDADAAGGNYAIAPSD